jgi:DNA-binding PadR family transcriptional regulator
VTKRERSVLATMLRSAAALTTYDLESLTGIRYGSITPRMKPLLSKGLVSEVGVDTAAGRGRTLYKITKDGVKWLKKNPVAA